MSYTFLSFDRLTSTSDLLKEHYSSFSHLTFIKTDFQTKGRGQFDRMWVSNPKENLLFSVLLKDLDVKYLDDIKKWIINGLMDVLNNQGIKATFKEPNDLYIGNDKICGILMESRTTGNLLEYVIIGVGLNVNQTEFLNLNATSMSLIKDQKFDINELMQSIIDSLLNSYFS